MWAACDEMLRLNIDPARVLDRASYNMHTSYVSTYDSRISHTGFVGVPTLETRRLD